MWYLYGPWDFPNLNFDINILIVTKLCEVDAS